MFKGALILLSSALSFGAVAAKADWSTKVPLADQIETTPEYEPLRLEIAALSKLRISQLEIFMDFLDHHPRSNECFEWIQGPLNKASEPFLKASKDRKTLLESIMKKHSPTSIPGDKIKELQTVYQACHQHLRDTLVFLKKNYLPHCAVENSDHILKITSYEPPRLKSRTRKTTYQPGTTYPLGTWIGQKGFVLSPYPPYRKLNVEGIKPGTILRDPVTDEIFKMPQPQGP